MKGFDILRVKSAVKSHNRMNLSEDHLTTTEFGQINLLYSRELVPGDKFNVKAGYFCRMAPLVKPTYGKFSFKTVNAFVPYHQIAVDADAWLAGKTTWEGQTPVQRCISIDKLDLFVRSYCISTSGATSSNSQYSYVDSSGTTVYSLFSKVGRYYVRVLNQLGYSLPQGVDLQSGSSWMTNVASKSLSAYPLLAFFKLYNDYMSQSQRFNSSALTNFLYCVKYNKTVTGYTPSTGQIGVTGLKTLFDGLFLNYENDYFTSAWQNPNTPLSALENVAAAVQPDQSREGIRVGLNDTFLDEKTYSSGGNDYASISQRALDFLKSFDSWVRRNNYSGSRAVQQVFARFGIKTDDYRSHYAQVISTEVSPVQVGDVTATADSTNVPLGDYAGKGIMSDDKGFSYQSSDHGLLIVLGYFTVVPMNSYGFDRSVLRTDPLEYYNPEFDGVGVDAISLAEVFCSPIAAPGSDLDTDVFGFTERYNNYRYGRDRITGDFRDFHANGDMNTWHTGRNLSALRSGGQLVAQSSAMNTLEKTDSQYNRIFSVTSGAVDHFYLTCHFEVDALRPMLSLNQVVNLGEGDTIVPRNGNVIA